MNKIKLKIGDEIYTGKMPAPLTVQTTLNDTLDSAQFVLPYLRRAEPFAPMTDVELQIGESEAVIWLLADDQVQEIMGTGRYTHTVTLVEYTKITERILMEAKSFTNPKVEDYADGLTNSVGDLYEVPAAGTLQGGVLIKSADIPALPSLTHPPYTLDVPLISELLSGSALAGYGENADADFYEISVYFSSSLPNAPSGQSLISGGKRILHADNNDTAVARRVELAETGFYTVLYQFRSSDEAKIYYALLQNIAVVADPIGRSPYTIQKVLDILLSIAEPRRADQICEWALSDSQRNMPCMVQEAPEFSFADSRSLWENLREIGRVIHAIPKITKKREKITFNEVSFDFLGGANKADLSHGKRISRLAASNIANFTAGLETMAANLVSAEGNQGGSIIEPYGGGYKSLRAASETARIQEGTSYIATSLPIENIVKVEAYFLHNGIEYSGDITPYIREKDSYDLLSSFTGKYPASKCYSLCYTRGSRNIDGLWFRPNDSGSDLVDSAKNYAITNILCLATGCNLNIFQQLTYPEISFRVEYIPTVTARIHHYRQDARRGAGFLANNQAANKLSAYALGENMRGQLAMLSTSTRSELWLFPKYEDIPKAGELVDDSMYISSVTARVYPGYCEAQIELSENYNEQGAFVEMPSKFRQYEIPAGNERHTVTDEFCYISDHFENDEADTIADYYLKKMIFYDSPSKITLAMATTYDEDGKVLAENLRFPVMGLAIGNSLYFGFQMLDNYAAGNKSVAGGKQYRMNQAVRYGDPYYSAVESISFSLYHDARASGDLIADATAFPETDTSAFISGGAAATTGDYPLIWHKDSADAGNIAYQLHFITDSGYIIGSGLASLCASVRGEEMPDDMRLYFFSERIHPISGSTDTSKAIGAGVKMRMGDYRGNQVDGIYNFGLEIGSQESPKSAKAWAIIRGGKFLLGKNESAPPKNIYFNFKRRLKK